MTWRHKSVCAPRSRQTTTPTPHHSNLKLSDEVLMWLSVWSEVRIVCIWSSWCHCHPQTPSSLASLKSRLVWPFRYQLTQGVLEKRPLNGCSSSSSSSSIVEFSTSTWLLDIWTKYSLYDVVCDASCTLFALYSRLYNRLCELCKWAQPNGAWAVQPGRLWRHQVDARSKAAVWTVDDVARLVELKKNSLFRPIFKLTFGSIWSWGMTKFRSITKLYSTYLFIYYMNIQNVSSSRLYKRLWSVDVLTTGCTTCCTV